MRFRYLFYSTKNGKSANFPREWGILNGNNKKFPSFLFPYGERDFSIKISICFQFKSYNERRIFRVTFRYEILRVRIPPVYHWCSSSFS